MIPILLVYIRLPFPDFPEGLIARRDLDWVWSLAWLYLGPIVGYHLLVVVAVVVKPQQRLGTSLNSRPNRI